MERYPETSPAAIRAEGIDKRFGATLAVVRADLQIAPGVCMGLVGANGAGKSTLVKILSGAERPDAGRIVIGEWAGHELTPSLAQRLGVATIYQEHSLVPTLGLAENIYLGREPTRRGFLSSARSTERARDLLRRVGLDPDDRRLAGELSPAHAQLVEIAKALYRDAAVLIMDEPTAALGESETERLFGLMRELKGHGVAILYISHRLDDVLDICDRVTVMRDGRSISDRVAEGLSAEDLVSDMIGHSLARVEREAYTRGAVALRLTGISQGQRLHQVNLEVHVGEVLGITGLVGSGRTRLLRVIYGLEHPDEGTMELFGQPYSPRGPHDAIAAGVGLIPEDRKRDALLLEQSLTTNITLAKPLTRLGGLIKANAEQQEARAQMDRLAIKAASASVTPSALSGGNQQKVVVGRWLHAGARLLIFDEPGQGVDVGAKEHLLQSIRSLASEGNAVLVVSQELDELQQVADRVAVLRQGRVVGVLAASELHEAIVIALSMGLEAPVDHEQRDALAEEKTGAPTAVGGAPEGGSR